MQFKKNNNFGFDLHEKKEKKRKEQNTKKM